jgi:hypothetical protein
MQESTAMHFERIPVTEVKRMTMDGLTGYPADLQELAQRIPRETDSGQMIKLVQQLIAKLDERQLQRCQQRNRGVSVVQSGQ